MENDLKNAKTLREIVEVFAKYYAIDTYVPGSITRGILIGYLRSFLVGSVPKK